MPLQRGKKASRGIGIPKGATTEIVETAQRFPTALAFQKVAGENYTTNFPKHDKKLEAVDKYIRGKVSQDPIMKALQVERMKDVPTGVLSTGSEEVFGRQIERGQELYEQFFNELKGVKPTQVTSEAVRPPAGAVKFPARVRARKGKVRKKARRGRAMRSESSAVGLKSLR